MIDVSPFWILIILANAFAMVGFISNRSEAFVCSILMVLGAFVILALGGAA